MIRVLVADDEAPARERLRRMLAAMPDVEIAGEAANGLQTMEQIAALRPDLVLLDIQMPGASGLEVAASLSQPRPRIIFCTAFDRYAVDAFELNAVDYLLKPVSRVRLAQAMERIREKPALESEREVDRVTEAARTQCRRVLAKCDDHFRVVPQKDIVYFSSADGLTRLNTRDRQFVLEPTLNELEERLAPEVFFRLSRAALVNLDFIVEVLPMPGGTAEVVMGTGVVLPVSRRRVRDLLERLGDMRSASMRPGG